MNILTEVVEKVNDLFVTTRYMHLVQLKKEVNGKTYYQSNVNKNDERKLEGKRPYTYLADWKIEQHLLGKETVGVFGTSFGSKFITFDVDFKHDEQLAKWTTLKIVNELIEIGIDEDKIYTSDSGNKGFHVDIYLTEILSQKKINTFYKLVMERLEFEREGDYSYKTNGGEVELRPIGMNLGVKIPLGVHQIVKKKCHYVDVFNRFTPFESFDYVLQIEKVDVDVIDTILEEQTDLLEEVKQVNELKALVKEKYNPLPIYEVGINEELTLEAYELLESEGLKQKGTRHNSLFKLARYYKYLGLTRENCYEDLLDWMEKQDTRMYDTPLQDCQSDINNIVQYVYDKDLSIVVEKDYIDVSYNEMKKILKAKSKNQKLLLFAMLIHSKRYADKNGVMYMTYAQMNYTTTLTEKNARINVRKLEEQGLVDIVASNVAQKGTFKKKPNKYHVKIADKAINGNSIEVKVKEDLEQSFNKALTHLVPINELKAVLPRRHWDEIKGLITA